MKTINALIIDDHPIVGEALRNRIADASQENRPFGQIGIVPHYLHISTGDERELARKIASAIHSNHVSVLVLDRGIYEIVTAVQTGQDRDKESAERMVYRKGPWERGKMIEGIFAHLKSDPVLQQIRSVILYSYDDDDSAGRGVIANALASVFSPIVPEDQIDLILTRSEIYAKAKVDLYLNDAPSIGNDLFPIGREADFAIYGHLLGEIIYHRILALRKRRLRTALQIKKWKVMRNVVYLYLILMSVSIGSAALFEWLNHLQFLPASEGARTVLIVGAALSLGVFLPLWVLALKPEWLIEIDEN